MRVRHACPEGICIYTRVRTVPRWGKCGHKPESDFRTNALSPPNGIDTKKCVPKIVFFIGKKALIVTPLNVQIGIFVEKIEWKILGKFANV